MMGKLFRDVSIASERETVLAAHADDSGRRLRFFSVTGELNYDSGEAEPLFFDKNRDVTQAIATGKYADRYHCGDKAIRVSGSWNITGGDVFAENREWGGATVGCNLGILA
jgi:hypothetical protein